MRKLKLHKVSNQENMEDSNESVSIEDATKNGDPLIREDEDSVTGKEANDVEEEDEEKMTKGEETKEDDEEKTNEGKGEKLGRRRAKAAKGVNGVNKGQKKGEESTEEEEKGEESVEEGEEKQKRGRKKAGTTKKERKKPRTGSRKSKREVADLDEEVAVDYEVEKIVGKRMIGRKVEYKVRWKGYKSNHDTWQSQRELNCEQLVREYEDEIKAKERGVKRTAESSTESRGKKKAKVVEEESEDEEFEVHEILEVKFKKNGQREFLVSWKGFSPKDNTWEPASNLHCPHLTDSFMAVVSKAIAGDLAKSTANTSPKAAKLSARKKSKRRR